MIRRFETGSGAFGRKLVPAILLACVLFPASSVWAQGMLLPDDRIGIPRPIRQSYKLDEFSIDVQIEDQIAQTQVTQTFRNTGSSQMEVSFVFPLPYDGAIDEMTFLVDGEEWEARLLPADEARQIYEGYVRRYQDPALLEWAGTGVFKTSVFPVPAGGTRTVSLNYSQLLRKNGQATDYVFPLSTARFSSVPVDAISFRAAIHSDKGIKNIYSPSHGIEIERDDDQNAVVKFEAKEKMPASDFRLIFDSDDKTIGANVISYWPEDSDEGYFILMASPEVKKESTEELKKSVLFVMDRSGSMNGKKIGQARDAAKFVVNNLNEGDLFNIIGYDTRVEPFAVEMERYDDDSRSKAIAYINGTSAGGGTNIEGALTEALKNVQDSDTPTYVVFMTDGRPTVGEQNEMKIVNQVSRLNPHGARIISFGVGYDVNSKLLDRLTNNNRGQSHYVAPSDDIEVAVSRLYNSISSPVLTDIAVAYDFKDADKDGINNVYPARAIDLFHGGQLVLVGRYSESGEATVEIKGRVGTEEQVFTFDAGFAAKGENVTNSFVEKLWAVRRVGEIIDVLDLRGHDNDLVEELVDLARRHGIVTRYTSFLADENAEGEMADGEMANRFALNGLRDLDELDNELGWDQRAAKQSFRSFGSGGGGGVGGVSGVGGGGSGFGGGGGRWADESGVASSALQAAPMANAAEGVEYLGANGVIVDSLNVTGSVAGVRSTANSCVYKRGEQLIAQNAAADFDASRAINIGLYSEEYFELVNANTREENEILASQGAGEELFVNLRGQLYCIKGDNG